MPEVWLFKRVRLRNWRNFTQGDLPLGLRPFLVGPNASGKSNFLDVFCFLRDLAVSGGGLQAALEKRGGMKAVPSLAARRDPTVLIEVEMERALPTHSDGQRENWLYRIAFRERQLNHRRERQVLVEEERVEKNGKALLRRPTAEDRADLLRLTQTHLEQVNMNKDFRLIADFFASIRYFHIVPQLIREPERSVGRKNDPYGGNCFC
ncbi:MAG: AAA family ATPase [Armatimonadetes bacterium]|nr:AAA family ATPase [Armatimonadota bacterium]MDW8122989.1 AAA family ATPase [Armatimonadota bacterium]